MSAENFHTARAKSGAVFAPDATSAAAALGFGDLAAEYQALTTAAALVDLPPRTRVDLTGADRADFLHNLSTNDIRRLTPGTSCEAFLLNAAGKILAYVNVFCEPDRLVLDTVGCQADAIIDHLDRYLIREDVTLTDRSSDQVQLLLTGADRLAELGVPSLPDESLASQQAELASIPVTLRRVDFATERDLLIDVSLDHAAQLWSALSAAGFQPVGSQAYEIARVQRGTPLYAVDIDDTNLPQELDRDDRTISFTKGCYIGQETVARIDALGHVNQIFRGLCLDEGAAPRPGDHLQLDGKSAARVTSVVDSPRAGAPLALGYVRRAHAEPGTQLALDNSRFTVVALPVA